MGELIKADFKRKKWDKRRSARGMLQDYMKFRKELKDIRSPLGRPLAEIAAIILLMMSLLVILVSR